VISILDGDVIDTANKEQQFTSLKKLFLPIPSLEKFLYKNLISVNDLEFIKSFGDKFFRTRSLNEILNDYKLNYTVDKDKNGKKLYNLLISNLYKVGVTEEEFVKYFCDDIYGIVDFKKFTLNLKSMLCKTVLV